MITHHTTLLQALIDKHGLKSYLEIGVQNPANNFDKISNRIRIRVGIDPCLLDEAKRSTRLDDDTENNLQRGDCSYRITKGITSDVFFDDIKCGFVKQKEGSLATVPAIFDVIFIDGDHTKEQVKRDFENSLRCLSDNGFIVIHDVLPDEEQCTQVPRSSKKWFGNVYQFAMTMNQYSGIGFITFDIDCGCMLIWKEPGKQPAPQIPAPKNWQTYQNIGKVLMNVTSEVVI